MQLKCLELINNLMSHKYFKDEFDGLLLCNLHAIKHLITHYECSRSLDQSRETIDTIQSIAGARVEEGFLCEGGKHLSTFVKVFRTQTFPFEVIYCTKAV